MFTPEQQQLIIEHENLIHAYMGTYRLSEDAIEDWYGILSITLCKAVLNFDTTKGIKFGNYIWGCFNRAAWGVKHQKYSVDSDISLYESITKDEKVLLIDSIPSHQDLDTIVSQEMAVATCYEKLNDVHKRIIDLCIYYGYSQIQVSKMTGLSRQTVCTVYNNFVKSVKEEYNKC